MGGGLREPVIICRCKDVTLEDVERALEEGCQTLECLRKLLGVGFGPCQGRTCIPILARIIARRTGRRIDEVELPTARPPMVPIPLKLLEKLEVEGGGD